MRAAPARAARRMTSALRVSIDRGARTCGASASITGMTRRSSSARSTGSAPGRVELGADVEDVGACRLELQGVRDRRVGGQIAPAVREAVGGDVDDAHDQWPIERQTGDGIAPPAHALEQLDWSELAPAKLLHRYDAPASLATIALDQLGGGEQQIAAASDGKRLVARRPLSARAEGA